MTTDTTNTGRLPNTANKLDNDLISSTSGPSHTTTKSDVYDRREQRAIGHFIEMVYKTFECERSIHGQSISYRGVLKELQREHACYD